MAASGSIVTPKKHLRDLKPIVKTTLCSYCERSFNSDRIAKHEEICGKLFNKQKMSGSKAEDTSLIQKTNVFPKRNWRDNNEKCLALIRSAKNVWAQSKQEIPKRPDYTEKIYQIGDGKLSASAFFMPYPNKGKMSCYEINEAVTDQKHHPKTI